MKRQLLWLALVVAAIACLAAWNRLRPPAAKPPKQATVPVLRSELSFRIYQDYPGLEYELHVRPKRSGATFEATLTRPGETRSTRGKFTEAEYTTFLRTVKWSTWDALPPCGMATTAPGDTGFHASYSDRGCRPGPLTEGLEFRRQLEASTLGKVEARLRAQLGKPAVPPSVTWR